MSYGSVYTWDREGKRFWIWKEDGSRERGRWANDVEKDLLIALSQSAFDHGRATVQIEQKTDYAELNLRWRRYGERLQLAMLELEERTRPDGDMADAPVNALVKNALLDAFDAYQPGSESEIVHPQPGPIVDAAGLVGANTFTFSEPVDSSGGPIGADVAARQWRENAVCNPLRPGLEAALSLVREQMHDGSTARFDDFDRGRERGFEQIEGNLIDRLKAVTQVENSQYSPEPKPTIDAFRWMGDLAAFEKWYGERCPVDFGGQISVPTKKDGPTWMRVWCGNWIIRRPDGEHYCMADANFRYMVEEWGDGLIPGECPAQDSKNG